MPTYAACNDYRKQVTGLCLAKDPIEARQLLHMRPTDKRRVVEMPDAERRGLEGWTGTVVRLRMVGEAAWVQMDRDITHWKPIAAPKV